MLATVQNNATISSGRVTITLSQTGRAVDFTVNSRVQFFVVQNLQNPHEQPVAQFGTVIGIDINLNQVTIGTATTGHIKLGTLVGELVPAVYHETPYAVALGTVQRDAIIASGSVTVTLSEARRAEKFALKSRVQFDNSGVTQFGTVTGINIVGNELTISTTASGTIMTGSLVGELSKAAYLPASGITDAMSFGLSPTNTPAQNETALTAAIMAGNGGMVYIPDGTYQINQVVITVPTHIKLSANAILQVPVGSPRPIILDINADHVTVEGGQFDGNDVKGNASEIAIRIIGSHHHIVIRNCIVNRTNSAIGAYNVTGGSNWLVEGCRVTGTVAGDALLFHGHPNNNATGVRGVRIVNNEIQGTAHNGIWVGNHYSEVLISGNRITNSGRMGIEVWNNSAPSGTFTGTSFVITNNIIDTSNSFGISIAASPYAICTGNIVKKATSFGIEIADSRFVTLDANIIEMVRSAGTLKPAGIVLNSPQDYRVGDVSIHGGVITNCLCAINLCGDKGARSNISVTGVTIRECQYGIRNVGMEGQNDGGGSAHNVAITGCNIYCTIIGIGNGLYGGTITSSTITGNSIYISGDANISGAMGIDFFRPSAVVIAHNRICGNNALGQESVGLRLRDNPPSASPKLHDSLVHGNHVSGFSSGIEFRCIYNSMIADNYVPGNTTPIAFHEGGNILQSDNMTLASL